MNNQIRKQAITVNIPINKRSPVLVEIGKKPFLLSPPGREALLYANNSNKTKYNSKKQYTWSCPIHPGKIHLITPSPWQSLLPNYFLQNKLLLHPG